MNGKRLKKKQQKIENIEKGHIALVNRKKSMSEQVKSGANDARCKVREFYETLVQRIDFVEKRAVQKVNDNINNTFKAEVAEFKEYASRGQIITRDCKQIMPPFSCPVERALLVREVSSHTFEIKNSRLLKKDWNNYITEVEAMILT